jgi:hypothetical protein
VPLSSEVVLDKEEGPEGSGRKTFKILSIEIGYPFLLDKNLIKSSSSSNFICVLELLSFGRILDRGIFVLDHLFDLHIIF